MWQFLFSPANISIRDRFEIPVALESDCVWVLAANFRIKFPETQYTMDLGLVTVRAYERLQKAQTSRKSSTIRQRMQKN